MAAPTLPRKHAQADRRAHVIVQCLRLAACHSASARDLWRSLVTCRLQRFKVLVDAGVFLDLPQYAPPPAPQVFIIRAIAETLDLAYKAAWDSGCAVAQPAGQKWRCFHAQYWPQAPGPVPVMFTEQLYEMYHIGEPGSLVPDRLASARHAMSEPCQTRHV